MCDTLYCQCVCQMLTLCVCVNSFCMNSMCVFVTIE